MNNKISAFSIIGFILAVISLTICGVSIFTWVFVTIPSIILCIIGIRDKRCKRTLAVIGLCIGIFSLQISIFAPPFINRVNKARGNTAVEYAENGDYDKAMEYINKITNNELKSHYKELIDEINQ